MKLFALTFLAAATATPATSSSACAHTTCTYTSLGDGLFRTKISTTMELEKFTCGKVDGTTDTCACECADHHKCTLDHANGDGTRKQFDHCAASAPEPAPAPAPSVCPVTWNGGCTNFHGKQLGTVPATTLKECHSKCAATAGCGAMFFSPADRTSCQLYRTGCIKNAGAVTWTYYLMDTCVSPPDTVVPLPTPAPAPATVCPKTWDGGCVGFSANWLQSNVAAATIKDCHDACLALPGCGGMFFHPTKIGVCSLYRGGCTPNTGSAIDRAWNYYAMDTCTAPPSEPAF